MNDSSDQNQPPGVDVTSASASTALALNDCWNKIGVGGDRSCLELEKHVHCRNCSVYSHAALQLFNRTLSPEYRREWTERYARPKQVSVPGKISVVVFRIGPEWLALPTQAFQEIMDRRPIHSLPHRRPENILGIINVRGELLPCFPLGCILGVEKNASREAKTGAATDRLVVASWNGHRSVFPVDEIRGIQRLQPEDLKEPPATIAQRPGFTRGVFAWQDKLVGLLDAEMVFAALNRNLS